ncbi:GNAT family N-acetyltransferase [Paenibacillus sp. USDA918EY]|uniref:GNAT family N-acetyltransferase n=1 Tax=Paenibacillus sp. USDA918EY TaxID=2689575 RepID=UPI003FA71B9E
MTLKIEKVFEYDLSNELEAAIQELLIDSFPDIYPKDRIYFKQLPHFRFLAFNEENQLIGHVGLEYRVMNLNGKPVKILGVIDLLEVDQFSEGRNIDFILLFTDKMNFYLRNGYKPVKNKCKWMKIDYETQTINGIGHEEVDQLMIKEVGKTVWSGGDLDFLGYFY